MADDDLLRAARAVWDAVQMWPEEAADVVLALLAEKADLADLESDEIVRRMRAASSDIEHRVADGLRQIEQLLAER